ncbi:tRNA lysidine(34) synthetase TilS [Mycetocola sp. 2940]|uniref:tRNA lysidine(34) synthetase TilS n=1 Tax=Mycetocola sp. 2940 TaxID=3156452 RepID=UPI0033996604
MPNNSSPRRPPLNRAVADVRLAVRRALAATGVSGRPDGDLVLVALSGGPDSLALAAATAFEAPPLGFRAGAVIVDHGLQDGSGDAAAQAAAAAERLGLSPVVVRKVDVVLGNGPEAAARDARYRAIDDVVESTDARWVLLGHTLDDQAETVLLGLARGSGAGSLRGMAPVAGVYLRPLLNVHRKTAHAACVAENLEPWIDPHNSDPRFTRVRLRTSVLPVLEKELGPGISEALVRTAEQLREDSEALDRMVEEMIEEICEPAEAGIAVDVRALAVNPTALRNRIIRLVASSEFGRSLDRNHTLEIARLVTDWHGQGPIDVPGIRVRREGGLIVFSARG